MTHRNKRIHSNSRARAKHIKCVRVRCFNIWSTKNPNAEQSEDSGFLSLHVGMLPTDVSPSLSRESTDAVRSAVKKTAAGKQSVEVLQNAPIIERAFCRSSSEIFEGFTDFERTLADICIGWISDEPGWKQYIKDNSNVLLKIAIKNLTHKV